MQRHVHLLMAILTILAMVSLPGCVKIDGEFVAQPDLSVTGKLLLGMDAQLMQGMGASESPFAELKSESMGELWTVREFEEGGWQYAEASGVFPAGAAPFGEEPGAPRAQVTKIEHRLTTRYTVRMSLPPVPSDAAMLAPPESTGSVVPAPPEGFSEGAVVSSVMPDLQAMMQSMLSGLQFRFALGGPGRVISTNGTVVGAGLAEWRPTMQDLSSGQVKELQVTTETLNWTYLGRLADQITGLTGNDTTGTRLAEAIQRGLLPNPPVNVSGVAKLGAEDYERLLTIIACLDAVLAPSETTQVLQKLGLNGPETTAMRIASIYNKAIETDFVEKIRTAQVHATVSALAP